MGNIIVHIGIVQMTQIHNFHTLFFKLRIPNAIEDFTLQAFTCAPSLFGVDFKHMQDQIDDFFVDSFENLLESGLAYSLIQFFSVLFNLSGVNEAQILIFLLS